MASEDEQRPSFRRSVASNSKFWEPETEQPTIQPQPTRSGLYLADGYDRYWITDDTSEAAWTAAVATVLAVVASNRMAIFARPKVLQLGAEGVVLKETRDLSLSA